MRAFIASLVSLSCVAGVAHAWTPIAPNNPVWQGPVPFKINQAGSDDMDFATAEAETVRAMLDWTRVECTSLVANYQGTTAEQPAPGNNTIGWMESGWPAGPGTLGITSPQMSFFPAASIVSASMWLNGQDHRWVVGAGGFGALDLYSIVLHEGGHYYGLGHTTAPGSTMAAAYGGGVFSLSADDIEGICTLYPSNGEPRDCSVTGCSPGEVCVAGVCEPEGAAGCQLDTDCLAGEVCTAGACAPAPAGCQSSAECAAGEACNAGVCQPMPTAPVDCPGGCAVGEQCDSGVCAPMTAPPPSPVGGCVVDTDCAAGTLCMAGACVGAQPPPPPTSTPPPTAIVPMGDECTFDADCLSGLCQVQGTGTVCTQTCAGSLDCPLGMACNLAGAPPTCVTQPAQVAGAPAAPVAPRGDGGSDGGCRAAGSASPDPALALAVVGLLWVRRRRSRREG